MGAGGAGGAGERIGIYLRLRPPRRSAGRVAAETEGSLVEFSVPKDAAQGLINNSRESYKFQFDGVFTPEAQQDAVFEAVGRPAVLGALEGINSTVFCYGQTGSGKTFTVTGGTERYADRGLIPRALAAVFQEIQRRSTHAFSVQVSYMELYNEEGFDLLDPTREVKRMEDLPKVFVMEDDDNRPHVRNLSVHRTSNEEEALNLLFLGDTNRMVAETPLNLASSRSHAIFTIQIEARKGGDDRVRRSKLNFVDLAGSERVTKTGIEGHILKEAKYINLSLHFLEQVIIALQERRPHVPYRNSLLTQMLRDSLGGNCRTVMVATVAPEAQHVEESISTCRFAQRVAMISNEVTVNEEVDPVLVIKRLKQENLQLRQELQLLKGGGGSSNASGSSGGDPQSSAAEGGEAGGLPAPTPVLGEADQARLRHQIRAYIEDASPDASLDVEASMLAIRTAFSIFKSLVKEGGSAGSRRAALERLQRLATGADGGQANDASAAAGDAMDLASEVESLRSALHQREREVALLVGMLRKQGADPQAGLAAGAAPAVGSPGLGVIKAVGSMPRRPGSSTGGQPGQQQQFNPPAAAFDDALLADKNRAFEYFCSSSPTHDAIQENKALLRGKYDDAKGLGAQVNASKQRIAELKSLIEQRRVQRSMAALMQGQQVPEGEDPEEERAKGLIDKEKALYREALGQLKALKSEIDQLQAMLDHSRGRLQREFAAWHALMLAQLPPEQRQQIEQQAAQTLAQQEQQQADWRIAAVQGGQQQPQPQPEQQAGGMVVAGQGVHASALLLAPQRIPSRQPSAQASAASLTQPSFSSWAPASPRATGSQGPLLQVPAAARPQSRPQTPGHTQQQLAGVSSPRSPVHAAAAATASAPRPPPSRSGLGSAASSAAAAVAAAAVSPPPARQPLAPAPADYGDVDPEVLAAARPLLTGNPAADADIIKFYAARAALLKAHAGYR